MSDKGSIFITGGSGLLALNWALSTRDKNTITLGMHHRNISFQGVNTCHCSLDSVDSVQSSLEEINPELVIHTAGLTSVEECETSPDLAHYANVEIAENVAKACSSLEIPLVHISTDHLFSGDAPMVDERQTIAPVNAYARTKAEAELHVLDACPEALVVRTNFYGWGPNYRSSFSDVIIDSLRKGQSVTLFQDVFYTPILISNLASTVMELVYRNAKGIFHVVGDERVSKYEFGLKVARQFSLDSNLIKPGYLSDNPGLVRRPFDMSLSNAKICSLLGRSLGGVGEHLYELDQQESTNIVKQL